MIYDCLDGSQEGVPDAIHRFTVNELIKLAKENHLRQFVFLNSERTINSLGVWRGNNAIPRIDTCYDTKTGNTIGRELAESLKETHYSQKGQKVIYTGDEIFHVSEYDRIQEFCVVGYRIDDLDRIELLTKICPAY